MDATSQCSGNESARVKELEAQVKTFQLAYESEGEKFDSLSSRYEEEKHSRMACESRLKHLVGMHRVAEQELYVIIAAMAEEDEGATAWKTRFCKLVSAVKPLLTHRE